MLLRVTSTHAITFKVVAYIATEGGMEVDSYGDAVQTIEEAVALLEMARASQKKNNPGNGDWIIQCDVQTTVQGK